MQADPDNRFIGAVPQLYDRNLGPIFFQPYAQEVAEHLKPGERAILETAAGTGVVTRTMAAARPDSRIVATDLNQAMLDIAAAVDPPPNASWQQADAQALPFADGSFVDLVVCCFGVMFMPDNQAAYGEAKAGPAVGRTLPVHGLGPDRDQPGPGHRRCHRQQLFPTIRRASSRARPAATTTAAGSSANLHEGGLGQVAQVEEVRRTAEVASILGAAAGWCQGTPMRRRDRGARRRRRCPAPPTPSRWRFAHGSATSRSRRPSKPWW